MRITADVRGYDIVRIRGAAGGCRRAGYAGCVDSCTAPSDPSFTQYAAPILAPAEPPTDADIDASLRATIGVLLEAARRAVEFPEFADQATVCTCVGAATDLLGALRGRL